METRAHYVLIGSIVLAAVAGAFLFILWLGQNRQGADYYDVIFRERVSGLSEGAPVRYNGIQKGQVESLTIDADDPTVVVARVRVGDDTPIRTDTKAELELVGITGLAIIQFVPQSSDAPLLKSVTRGIPKIEADTSGFAMLLEGSGDIITAANLLLSDENVEAIKGILANVNRVTGVIAERDAEIGEAVASTAVLTKNLADASARLDQLMANLDALLKDDAPETLREARAMIAETRDLVHALEAVVEENRDPIAVFTEQGLAQVGPAVAEARRLFSTLDQVLRELDRDPRGYLLGESTPQHEGGEE